MNSFIIEYLCNSLIVLYVAEHIVYVKPNTDIYRTKQQNTYLFTYLTLIIMKANHKSIAIKTIIENSSSFICNNVAFVQKENRFSLFSPKHEQFYSTDLVVSLSAFTNYISYDHDLNKVVFVVLAD